MNKFRAAILAILGVIGLGAGASIASIQLGGSIFPLTYITTPPWNLTDAFNQMEALINQQVMPNGTIIAPPGGRLSLTSDNNGIPVKDVALESNVFYMPYTTELVPIYNGTAGNPWSYMDFGASGMQLTLGSIDTSQTVGGTEALYDVYAFNNGGTPTICKVAWGGTTRSTTAGGGANGTGGTQNVAIQQINGIWTNKAQMLTANCYGGTGTAANNTPVAYTFNSNAGTLLGTISLPNPGGISQLCRGASGALTSAAGGLNSAGVNVSNIYNRIPINCSNIDNAQTTSASSSWAAMGNHDAISWVDSIGQTSAIYTAVAQEGGIGGGEPEMGVTYASNSVLASTGTPNIIGTSIPGFPTLASNWTTVGTSESINPNVGMNTLWLEKASVTGTATYGLNSNGISLNVDLAY